MGEREWLERQIATLEQQRLQALAAVAQCDGGLKVCRHRLAMLEREGGESARPIPVEANGG